jgi:hypothetical protein
MPPERDFLGGPVNDPAGAPQRLSDWLQDQDVRQLAVFARAARDFEGSFGRALCEHE